MFKYYKISDISLVEKIIGSNPTIKFSQASNFNDPFEFKFNFKINPNSKINKINYFKTNPNHTLNDFETWKNGINDNFIWYLEQEIRKVAFQTYRLTCFSRSNENNLMWSHYADNHKGICIEYSDDLLQYFKSSNIFLGSGNVQYSIHPASISISEDIVTMAKKIFFKKQSEWRYEKEFRIILNSSTEYFEINPKFIKSVTIGSKCSYDVSSEIIRICERNNIKIYHAIAMGKDYKIKIEEHKTGTIYMKAFS